MNASGVGLAVSIVFATACFSPSYNEVRCDRSGACPDGLTCDVDGLCRSDALAIDAQESDARPTDARPSTDALQPTDALTTDALTTCPAGYTSGYRYISAAQTWRAAEGDCEDDSTGVTHLIVINDQAELAAVNAAVATDIWVGVVRDPVVPDGPSSWQWRWVTGGPALFLPWEASQPDNASGAQFAVSLINATGQLRDIDVSSTSARAALCECDGLPPINADYLDP